MTEPIGALFALLVLGSFLTPLMVGMSLAFVGGIMAIVSFKELIPQAMAQNRNQYMIVGMTFGAAIMQLSLFLLE
jgi:zinc transporter ZupT